MNRLHRGIPAVLAAIATIGCALPGDRSPDIDPATAPAEGEAPQAWRCGDLLVETRLEGDALLLDLPGERLRLKPVAAASGSRYTDGEDTGFWNKGDDAMLRVYGEVHPECAATGQRSPWAEAAERGLRLRAAGQEPGWLLEVGAGAAPSVRLLLDYGQRELQYDAADITESEGVIRITSRDGRVSAVAEDARCRDIMSGHRFPLSLELRVDDNRYHGCGRAYAATPADDASAD